MLVAVEGPSAVGKTTLLRRAAPAGSVVGEEWEAVGVSRAAEPAEPLSHEAQGFWMDLKVRRWALLLGCPSTRPAPYRPRFVPED